MSSAENNRNKQGLSLTSWIVIGVIVGVICGLFFGEQTQWIKWIGDAFVGLLQMAVVPYVAFSLVANIGGLSVKAGMRLMLVSVLVLLFLWSIGILVLAIMSQSFPAWESGSFFSSRFTEEPVAPDWLALFIPSNPFRSLADNSIPAVVVFCIGLGIALMTLPNKQRLLEPLSVLVDALTKLNKLVVRLTPLGIFGIVAHTAGTLDLREFSLIQGYLLSYGAASFLVSFIVLPTVIATLTPLKFRDVFKASRDPLIAAFVIGNSFVVLPMIIDAVNRLLMEHRNGMDESRVDQAEYLVPLGYPFPDVGRIVGLVFIPFAGWFYGMMIDPETLPTLLGVGILGSFAKPIITIPFLMDIAELPSDIFNLWLASGVVAARFGDLMKTMHLMTFTILTTCLLNGSVRFNPVKILLGFVAAVALLGLAAFSIRVYLDVEFKDRYSREQLVTERTLVFPQKFMRVNETVVQVLDESQPHPVPLDEGQTRVQRIKDYGKIRIGFDPDQLPYSYFNKSDELIGLDVQMAWYLAHDLGVSIEFIPIQHDKLRQQLEQDHIDVAMSAFEGTIERFSNLGSAGPYMFVTFSVVVSDHDKDRFPDVVSIVDNRDHRLAVVKNSLFAERAASVARYPDNIIQLDSAAEYFDGTYLENHGEVDGLIMSAEAGSAWTLRWPRFTVANPAKGNVRVPLYYLTAQDERFENFLQRWLEMRKADGTFQTLYEYWILGEEIRPQSQRWSILRDVLGWVD